MAARPSSGKGERWQLAQALRAHPSLITQILKGKRDLTLEQAFLACAHFAIPEVETEYFVDLVQWERAGNPKYKAWLASKLKRARGNRPRAGLDGAAPLSDHERAIFYSAWYYSAIHLTTALPGPWTVKKLSERLRLPGETVRDVLGFLVSAGLCTVEKGLYRVGLQKTVIQDPSTHLDRFLTNWRLRGIEKIPSSARPQIFHSQQLCLSAENAGRVRELLLNITAELGGLMKASVSPDAVYCLNIDWFQT